MAKRPPSIPDSELDVLKVLWDRGQATVREVLETLRSAGRQWSYATVATLLDRLETKGVVTSDRSELAFVYRPVISNQEVRQKRVNNLVDKLYQGEPGLLVLHLLKSHPLAPDQAKEVRALLEEMTGDRSKKKSDGKLVGRLNRARPLAHGPSTPRATPLPLPDCPNCSTQSGSLCLRPSHEVGREVHASPGVSPRSRPAYPEDRKRLDHVSNCPDGAAEKGDRHGRSLASAACALGRHCARSGPGLESR